MNSIEEASEGASETTSAATLLRWRCLKLRFWLGLALKGHNITAQGNALGWWNALTLQEP